MKLSEFLKSPYTSTELCSIIPASIREMDPELKWEDEKRAPQSVEPFPLSYPEEVEVSFQKNSPGLRFSFDNQGLPAQTISAGTQTAPGRLFEEKDPIVGAAAGRNAPGQFAEDGSTRTSRHRVADPADQSSRSLNDFGDDPPFCDREAAGPGGLEKRAPALEDCSLNDESLPARQYPMNSEIRMYNQGRFVGQICYEMNYERATLITLEPTEWHNDRVRDFVRRVAAAMEEPGINWYLGFGWGALAQVRNEENDECAIVIKDSENRYTMEFYYPGAEQELEEMC